MRSRGPVAAITVGVAAQLARDRRRRAAQTPSNTAHRLAPRRRQSDLLTLGERQVAALQIPTTARTHPARRSHPARSLLAIRPSLRGGVGDELTPLQRSPKRLNSLVDHALSKDSHRHHLRIVGVLRRPREPKVPAADAQPGTLRMSAGGSRAEPSPVNGREVRRSATRTRGVRRVGQSTCLANLSDRCDLGRARHLRRHVNGRLGGRSNAVLAGYFTDAAAGWFE